MNFTQLKNLVCCLLTRVEALETGGGGGGGGGGTSATQITAPDVSTYNDSRGAVGDWSWNPTLDGGTYFFKVSTSPHQWVSDSRALS